MLLVPMLAVVTLSLSDASTAEVRNLPQNDEPALDVHTVPMSRLGFGFKRSELSLFYAPNFGWLDVTRDNQFVLMHQAGIAEAFWGDRWRLTAAVIGALGHESYLTGAAAPALNAMGAAPPDVGAPADPANPPQMQQMQQAAVAYLPARQVLKTAYLRGSLTLTYALTPRWDLATVAAYEVAGGLDASKEFLPLRRGPVGSVSLTHALTHRDDLTSTLSSFLTDVPQNHGRFVGVTGLETWLHRFAAMTTASLGAGATYLWSRPAAGADKQRSVLATGLATFGHGEQLDPSTVVNFGLTSSLAATYNPVLGTVGQQLSEGASVGMARDRTTLGLGAQAAQSLPFNAANATKSYGGSATVSYKLADPVLLRLGGTWTHQVLPDTVVFAGAPADQWQVYLSVILTAPPITM